MHLLLNICTLISWVLVCFCELESKECGNLTGAVQLLPDDSAYTFVLYLENKTVLIASKMDPDESAVAQARLDPCWSQTHQVNVCSMSFGCQCYTNITDGSPFPHVSPIVVQQGVTVNITVPHNRTVQFYRATTETFQSCAIRNNETVPVFNITTSSFALPMEILETGSNLFICTDPNDFEFTCENNCRLNITVKVNECQETSSPSVCNGNGICSSSSNETSFTCKCFDGFGGKLCEIINVDDIHPSVCEDNMCLNGGTCIVETSAEISNNQSTSKCECPHYVTGEFCETILNKCKSSPCVNGVCVEHVDGYQCYCIPGFHGKQCKLEYNECLSNPCLNSGTCVDRVDKFECHCSKGFTGTTCQNKVDFCHPNPCHKNSTCKAAGDSFHCVCAHGYKGTLCDQRVKSCDSSPCRNHGTCIEFEHGHQCMCPVTFAGQHCEYMMDVFAPPMEGADESHKHNLYIVAGTLGSMVLIVVSVIIACYCKIYETYKQLMWRRLRYYRKRSNSCPDLETCNEPTYIGKHRLSADAIWEATSLCHENAAFENISNHQTFGNTSLQI